MGLFSNLFGGEKSSDLEPLINAGAFLVDVRSEGEFAKGHVKGSVNIPLDTIPKRLNMFREKGNIIFFCRSGNRSGQAKSILEKNGFSNVTNGGTWQNVNQFVK